MSVLERTVVELGRRIELLPQEVGLWKQNAAANAQALGIHHSQIDALKLLMDGLVQQQANLKGGLSAAAPLPQFVDNHYKLATLIIGTQELWQVVRTIFAQRQDPYLKSVVDTADLIAADCYLTCMDQARQWGLKTEQQYREPPLTYLQAAYSPATATRGHGFGALGLPVKHFRDQRLPIPIILLPRDHSAWIWLFCSIHHEVGHSLDQDLNLRGELAEHVAARLKGACAPLDRIGIWRRWTAEVLGDAFGVLLGGAGFAHTLSQFLLLLAPKLSKPAPFGDEHPHPWVRIDLVAALLRCCQVAALTDAAETIEQVGDRPERPAWAGDYRADCMAVAKVVMDQPLTALGNRPLRQLIPNLANDVVQVTSLANFLSTGLIRPHPNIPNRFPWRLVPVASQLAVARLEHPTEADLDRIQAAAMEYFQAIIRPALLGPPVSRSQFLSQLVSELDFRPSPLEDSP